MATLDMTIITLITVFVIDMTDFIPSTKRMIYRVIAKKPGRDDWTFKPFDCSLCMTFWLSLTYLLITSSLTLPHLLYACLCSYFTPVIRETYGLAYDFAVSVIAGIREYFNIQ